MVESSGNEQYFVRMKHKKNTDDILNLKGTLEYRCYPTMWQREVVRTAEECMQCCWTDASMLSRFIGSNKEDVLFVNMTKDEVECAKKDCGYDE